MMTYGERRDKTPNKILEFTVDSAEKLSTVDKQMLQLKLPVTASK